MFLLVVIVVKVLIESCCRFSNFSADSQPVSQPISQQISDQISKQISQQILTLYEAYRILSTALGWKLSLSLVLIIIAVLFI